MKALAYGLVLAGCLFALGCNETEAGAAGNLFFTPNNCGRPSLCDFDDGIGLGGRVNVTISGRSGFPTAGVELFSDDPNIFDVQPTADIAGEAAWEITALGDGVTRLYAVDADDIEVDFITVDIRPVARLGLGNTLGNAVGPQADPDFDELWTVQAGDSVVFWVYPFDDLDVQLMGAYDYALTLDADIDDNLTDPNPESGRLAWTVPLGSGSYAATFDNGEGNLIDVLFDAP